MHPAFALGLRRKTIPRPTLSCIVLRSCLLLRTSSSLVRLSAISSRTMAAPQDDNTTLRRLLSQRKPQISCEMTNGRNSSSEKWPEVAGCITVWDEFNIENLGESYGHVLDSAVPAALPDASQILSGITIKKSEDIYHLIAWNDRMLQLTLEAAKSLVGAHPGTSLRRTFSTADRSFIARLSGPGGIYATPGGTISSSSTIFPRRA